MDPMNPNSSQTVCVPFSKGGGGSCCGGGNGNGGGFGGGGSGGGDGNGGYGGDNWPPILGAGWGGGGGQWRAFGIQPYRCVTGDPGSAPFPRTPVVHAAA